MSFNYDGDYDAFTKAMTAAIWGPPVEEVSIQAHGFNVKRVQVGESEENKLLIDGSEGFHLSHRRKNAKDDQLYYKVTIDKRGELPPHVELNVVNGGVLVTVAPVLKFISDLVELLKNITEDKDKDKKDQDLSVATFNLMQQETGIPVLTNPQELLNRETAQWVIGKAEDKLDGSWTGAANFLITSITYYALLNHAVESLISKKTSELKVSEELARWLWIIQNDGLHRVDPATGLWETLAGTWNGHTSIAALSGRLYIIQNDGLHRTDPATGLWETLAGTWNGHTSMAALGDRLYVIQNDGLHRVDPATGLWETLAGTWNGHTSMTALGDRLYVIENEKLRRVDPVTGNWETLARDWIGHTSMTALGDRLYVIENEKLRRVDPVTGNWETLAGDWIGHTSMTALGDRLYVIENEKLRRVDPVTGNWENLAGTWNGLTSMTSFRP